MTDRRFDRRRRLSRMAAVNPRVPRAPGRALDPERRLRGLVEIEEDDDAIDSSSTSTLGRLGRRLGPKGRFLAVAIAIGTGITVASIYLERWSNEQLRSGGNGRIPWERLPAELRRSGGLLRQALDSHGRIRSEELDAVVAAGLGGLLAQPEFRHSSSLLPVVQLVEHGPRALLGITGGQDPVAAEAIWIGTEHPHAALGQCAVVQATYRTGHGGRGQVGLVGPMRMAYATARAAVQSVASILERLLS